MLNFQRYFDHTKYGRMVNSVVYLQSTEETKNGGYLGLLFSDNNQQSRNCLIKSITIPKDSINSLGSAGTLNFHLLIGDKLIIEDIFTSVPLTTTAGTDDVKVDLNFKDAPANSLRFNPSYRCISDVIEDCAYGGTSGAPVNVKYKPIADNYYYRNFGVDDFTPWSYNIIFEFKPTTPTDDITGKTLVVDSVFTWEVNSESRLFTKDIS